MEVAGVSVYAVRMKGDLCPLGDDSEVDDGKILVRTRLGDHINDSVDLQLPEYFGTFALVH